MPNIQERQNDTFSKDDMVPRAQNLLDEYLSRRGLKRSSQRNAVLRVFLSAGDCFTIQQLYDCVRGSAPSISYTTVYRSLTLFTRCGLAAKVEYLDGTARFAHCFTQRSHHHAVCTVCGHAVDFNLPEPDWFKLRVEEQLRYLPLMYWIQVCGICENCQRSNG